MWNLLVEGKGCFNCIFHSSFNHDVLFRKISSPCWIRSRGGPVGSSVYPGENPGAYFLGIDRYSEEILDFDWKVLRSNERLNRRMLLSRLFQFHIRESNGARCCGMRTCIKLNECIFTYLQLNAHIEAQEIR